MLTREGVKKELLAKGVRETLLEIPAIMERAYRNFSAQNLKVEQDGSFSIEGIKFFINDDGRPMITGIPDEFSRIYINEYGIEESYDNGYTGPFNSLERKNGKYENTSGNADSYQNTKTFLDSGDLFITDSQGERIASTSDRWCSEEVQTEISERVLNKEQILAAFDEKARETIEIYPKTAPWYEKTREQLVELIDLQNDPQEKSKREIKRLQRKISSLEQDLKREKSSNERLTSMLDRSLRFIEVVRGSAIGHVFFGKHIKEYEENRKNLPEGSER